MQGGRILGGVIEQRQAAEFFILISRDPNGQFFNVSHGAAPVWGWVIAASFLR
jgi:hypothetical protein